MRQLIAMAFGAALLWLSSSPAAAQDCSPRSAQVMTIAAITGDGTAAHGRCVTVEGIQIGNRLYTDAAAIYLRERVAGDPSSSGAVLGLNGARDGHSTRVRLTGRVETCASVLNRAMAASSGDLLVTVGGYCHHYGGLALYVIEQRRLGAARLTRIPLARRPPELGNLSLITDGAVRRTLEQRGLEPVTALLEIELGIDRTASDRLRTMLRPAGGRQRSDAEVDELVRIMMNPRGPFQNLVAGNARPQIAVLGWREPLWATEDSRADITAAAANVSEGFVCVSSHPDAAALWPIDERDADNAPERPYACMRVMLRGTTAEYDVPEPLARGFATREP